MIFAVKWNVEKFFLKLEKTKTKKTFCRLKEKKRDVPVIQVMKTEKKCDENIRQVFCFLLK